MSRWADWAKKAGDVNPKSSRGWPIKEIGQGVWFYASGEKLRMYKASSKYEPADFVEIPMVTLRKALQQRGLV